MRGAGDPIFFLIVFFTFTFSLTHDQPYESMTGSIGQRLLTYLVSYLVSYSGTSPKPMLFHTLLVGRPVRRTFHGCQGHSGIGRDCNMKVCVVVSKSRLSEHILLFNSWPSRCSSCPSFPPSFLLATCRFRGTRSKLHEFFFSLL